MNVDKNLKKGDIIKCSSAVDMVMTDQALNEAGYITEYIYKINNEKGLWIEIRGRANADDNNVT